MMSWLNKSILNRFLAVIIGGNLIIAAAVFYSFKVSGDGIGTYNDLLDNEVGHTQQISGILSLFQTQVQEWKNIL